MNFANGCFLRIIILQCCVTVSRVMNHTPSYKEGIVPIIVLDPVKTMFLMESRCKIKMIDPIQFLPMALAKVSSMFSLNEFKKDISHICLTGKKNGGVRQADASYYHSDSMKPDDRNKFIKCYKQDRHGKFGIQQALLAYCRYDVDIWRCYCLKFREDSKIVQQYQ